MAENETPAEQSIEQLQRRYSELNERKIRSQAQREEAQKQLDKLQAEARDKYGTDNVAELQRKLDEMIADNARKRAAYQADLDKIEQGLAEVERKFGVATSPISSPPAAPRTSQP